MKMHLGKIDKRNVPLGAETMHTLEQHRLPISCSTPIDRDGTEFNFLASF